MPTYPHIKQILEQSRFDTRNPPKEDTTVLTIQGKTIGTLGNYIAISGKPKTGKSTYLSAMLSSAFMPSDIWGMKVTLPPGREKIAVIDTEQSPFAFFRLMNRVKSLIGMDNVPRNLTSYLAREYEPDIILSMIEAILEDPEVSLLMLDGLLDLVKNFNDEREAFNLTRFLKKITKQKNILAIGIIHQSKSQGYSLGHLGSSVDRYAESTLLIEKDDSRRFISLSAGLLRNTIEEFNPITIMWNGSDFVQTDIDIKAKKEKSAAKSPRDYGDPEHRYMITQVIPTKGIIYQSLVEEICENKGVSKIKAKDFVRYWLEKSFIKKGPDGAYTAIVPGGLFNISASA